MHIERVKNFVPEENLEKELSHEGIPVLSYRMTLPRVESLSPAGLRRMSRCYRKLKKVLTAWCEGPLYNEAIASWQEALASSAFFAPYRVELSCENSNPQEDSLIMHCNCKLIKYGKAPALISFPAVWHLPDGWLFPDAFSPEKMKHRKHGKKKNADPAPDSKT